MSDLRRRWWAHLQEARWFGGKGREGSIAGIEPMAWHTPPGVWPAVRSEIAEVAYATGATERYHLLVAYRPGDIPDALATVELPGQGRYSTTEAITDPEAVTVLAEAVAPGHGPARTWLLDQSNSMIALGDDALLKVLRRIEPGPSLDADALAALAGTDAPRLLGRLVVGWPDGLVTDVGLVVERIKGATDGFELGTAACTRGESFTQEAAELGATLARVHERLGAAFGVAEASGDTIADTMSTRLTAACRDVPLLQQFHPVALEAFDGLRGHTLAVQRIHGDFHLGQALWADGAWTLLDFEGEPARPVAERRRPDSPWRDVAGLLRSLDYATAERDETAHLEAAAWADEARAAFLAGYCGTNVLTPQIVTAYEIDKAIYEVCYELRNRPAWAHIPLRALQRQVRISNGPPDTKE